MAITKINLDSVGRAYSALGTTDTNEVIFENPFPQDYNIVVTAVEAVAGAAMLKYRYIVNSDIFSIPESSWHV